VLTAPRNHPSNPSTLGKQESVAVFSHLRIKSVIIRPESACTAPANAFVKRDLQVIRDIGGATELVQVSSLRIRFNVT